MKSTKTSSIVEAFETHDINLVYSLIDKSETFTSIEIDRIIKYGNIDIVKHLLSKDFVNTYCNSCLASSVYFNYYDITKLLIENGANSNIGKKVTDNPLIIAIQNQSYEIVKLLVDNNAKTYQCKVNKELFPTEIAIDICIKKQIVGSKEEKDTSLNIVKCLYENNGRSKPNTLNHIKALEIGFIELVDLFIKYEKLLSLEDEEGNDCFAQAALKDNLKAMKTLLLYNIDINKEDNWGTTTLMKVTSLNNIEIVKFLIAEGAEIDVYDMEDNCALSLAMLNSDLEVFNVLFWSLAEGRKFKSVLENSEIREKLLKSPSIRICAYEALVNYKHKFLDKFLRLGIDPYDKFCHGCLELPTLVYASCNVSHIYYFKKFYKDNKENVLENTNLFLKACSDGVIMIIKHILNNGTNLFNYNSGLVGIGILNVFYFDQYHDDILKLLLSFGAKCNVSLNEMTFFDYLLVVPENGEFSKSLSYYNIDITNLKDFNFSKYYEMFTDKVEEDHTRRKIIYEFYHKKKVKLLKKYSKL